MIVPKTLFSYAVLLAVLLEPISGRKGFGGSHSYPKSTGLSGGGHRSGGLSGGGQGYPSHAGQGHGYPSHAGQGHTGGGGLSGGGHGSHGYSPSGGSHGYPPGGLSGNGHGYSNKPAAVHQNYHYSPPSGISYTPARGGPTVNYPVYQGAPPTYVYQYKDSGSKYGTMLAGLALLNLGTLGTAAYALSRTSGTQSHYKAQPGDVCKFAVKKDNGDYEETKIDCQIISSFILQDQAQQNKGSNTTVSVVTVTNTTVVNSTNMMPDQASTPAPLPGNVLYAMLPNGTLVPVNTTGITVPGVSGNPVMHNETGAASPNGTVMTSSVVTTTTNTTHTLVDALDVKGQPVKVTPGMQCFVIRISPTSNMKKTVPCDILVQFAEKSIKKNSAAHNGPMFTLLAVFVAFCVAY